MVEGSRARLDHREHLHASPGPAERRRTRTLESSPHQHEEFVAGQRQLLRQVIDQGREHLTDRLGTGGVGTPAQPRVEETAEAPQVLCRVRLRRPRLQDRHEGGRPPHGAAEPGARQAAVRCNPPAAALVALLLRHLDEPAPHRQRQRAVPVQQRTHLERGDVAHACGPAAVQGQADVEPSESGRGGEPTVGRRLRAPPQQLRERSRAPRRGVDRGEAAECGKWDREAREVHPIGNVYGPRSRATTAMCSGDVPLSSSRRTRRATSRTSACAPGARNMAADPAAGSRYLRSTDAAAPLRRPRKRSLKAMPRSGLDRSIGSGGSSR